VYSKIPVTEDIDVGLAAAYDHSGRYIFVGNGRGKVVIVETPSQQSELSDTDGADKDKPKSKKVADVVDSCTPVPGTATLRVVHSFRASNQQTSAAAVRSIEFSRRGQYFLVNTADRIIRVYETRQVMPTPDTPSSALPEIPDPTQKLQDLVNK
jgi:COMPASS component SWD1